MKNGYRRIVSLIVFTGVCFAVTGIGLMLMAFFMNRIGLSKDILSIAIIALYAMSAFVGGFFAGKSMKNKKFLWGFLTGTLYFGVIFALSWWINGGVTAEEQKIITTFLLCGGGGMLGGMLS